MEVLTCFKRKIIYKWGIVHCHVWLLEGGLKKPGDQTHLHSTCVLFCCSFSGLSFATGLNTRDRISRCWMPWSWSTERSGFRKRGSTQRQTACGPVDPKSDDLNPATSTGVSMNQDCYGSGIVGKSSKSATKSSKIRWVQIPSSKNVCVCVCVWKLGGNPQNPVIDHNVPYENHLFPGVSSQQNPTAPSWPWATARQHHSAILRGWSDVFHGDDLIRVQLHVIDELHDLLG